ncbi:BlaI/MecI/CopY family transcriptional regulator [Pleomorphovibrio marinus]|uniref:BlaI/MecI/CopY family transcriptional regulator n=1 Tax=Pleomorphovibrio marinus TaxID=2164132 RepID=UPI000E0B64E9|nr:BlaI/MecI/CopY family transcriptional regulator [Pleomorphovibrio marinus]
MERLTETEEQLMHIIWSMEKVLIREVLEKLPSPKPPYTTLASHFRQLEKKGFLDHLTYGNTYQYFPLVSKEAYQKSSTSQLINNYFGGSAKNFLSFLVNEEKLSKEEITELKKLIEQADKK